MRALAARAPTEEEVKSTPSAHQRDQTLCMQQPSSPLSGEGQGRSDAAAKTLLRTVKDSIAALRWLRQSRFWHTMWLGLSAKEPTTRILSRCLVLGAFLLPVALFAVVAWQDRNAVLDVAQRDVLGTVEIFSENAHNVFGTHKLVANLLNDHIRGLSWQEIADSQTLHDYMAEVAHDNPQIQSLWLIDSVGIVRNSSAIFPAPSVSVADRDYFDALRKHDTLLGKLSAVVSS
jgi:hypothetical protein